MTEAPDAPKGVSSGDHIGNGDVGGDALGDDQSVGDRPVDDHVGDDGLGETVGEVSRLYLGNILYAIERCALGLDNDGKPADAAFYRGIGRKLAEAYGREKRK